MGHLGSNEWGTGVEVKGQLRHEGNGKGRCRGHDTLSRSSNQVMLEGAKSSPALIGGLSDSSVQQRSGCSHPPGVESPAWVFFSRISLQSARLHAAFSLRNLPYLRYGVNMFVIGPNNLVNRHH